MDQVPEPAKNPAAQALGRLGGQVVTRKKSAAARKNALKATRARWGKAKG